MQIAAQNPSIAAQASKYSVNKDLTHIVGTLEAIPLEGLHYHVRYGAADQFVYIGVPQAIADAKLAAGDLVELTGKVSDNQFSFTQDGVLYDVATLTKFNG